MDITLKEIIAATSLIFAFWKYIDIRKRELLWNRTEFLFKQAELLDNDPDINLATSVLDGADTEVKLEELFDAHGNINNSIDKKYRIGFEKCVTFYIGLLTHILQPKLLKKMKFPILVGISKAWLITNV